VWCSGTGGAGINHVNTVGIAVEGIERGGDDVGVPLGAEILQTPRRLAKGTRIYGMISGMVIVTGCRHPELEWLKYPLRLRLSR